MKLETLINFVAVALISGYVGKRIQMKKDAKMLKQLFEELEERKNTPKERASKAQFDVVFETRKEAEQVLELLRDIIYTYDLATCADYYDLVGLQPDYKDNRHGWTDLKDAVVKRVSRGYIIDLPNATYIV